MATEENNCRSSPLKQIPSAAADGRSKFGDGEDLVLEVLIRLPDPRSAWRCKLVCKRWNSLISTAYFSRRFVSHHRSLSAGETEPEPLVPLKVRELIRTFLPLPPHFDFFILDCFKDLLLLEIEVPGRYCSYPELHRTYLVCNPFTKQWVALPLAPKMEPPMERLGVKLVCKPCDSSISLDLGIHSGYWFRVVCVSYVQDSQLDVFCSKSGEWMTVVLSGRHGQLVSLDDELYWGKAGGQVVSWNPFYLDGTPPSIICQQEDMTHLRTSQGALYMILMQVKDALLGDSTDALCVWKLEKEGSSGSGRSWKKQYEVSLEKLRRETRNVHEIKSSAAALPYFFVLGLHQVKPEIVFLEGNVITGLHPVVFSCNLKTEEVELFPDQTGHRKEPVIFQPRVNLWPTRIPNYEKLRGMYDGSYHCFVQGKPMEELLLDGLQLS